MFTATESKETRNSSIGHEFTSKMTGDVIIRAIILYIMHCQFAYALLLPAGYYIPYVAKYWWGKILANLANHSYDAKINPTKILPLNTEFIAPVIIISCKHGRLVEYRTYC